MMIKTTIKGVNLQFKTAPGVFSPQGIDEGTLAMLSQVTPKPEDRVLDLGCGYGVVGILCAKIIGDHKVVMVDINPTAVDLARQNAELNAVPQIRIYQSDGFDHLPQTDFTLILSNPPYHSDFSVAKGFIEKGFNRLTLGGRLFMVTKRKEWYKNKLVAIYGGVKITEIAGYYVFMAEKRDRRYARTKKQGRK